MLLLMLLTYSLQSGSGPVHCAASLFPRQKAEAALIRRGTPSEHPSVRPQVGDKQTFWLFNMSVMPPRQYQKSATCFGRGGHCYVYVEDSCWQVGIVDSTMILRILERFERSSPADPGRGIWQHNTRLFGMPPDEIDHDSLIYILYYNIGTFHGITFDGFWMFYDEYYDSVSYPRWGYHSNEVEVVYIDCYPSNPSQDSRMSIVAHEFEHMIHWNYDEDELPWVDEGCAELAMLVYGWPDAISEFNGAPDNDLTLWTGSWGDYIKTYLWSLYLYEQFGEYRRRNLIRNLVDAAENSTAGVDSALARCNYTERFGDIFDDWVMANYCDDTVSCAGRYGYYEAELPPFLNSGWHTTYPVSAGGSVTRWAADYSRFLPPGKANLDLRFDGTDQARFSVRTVKFDTVTQSKVVARMPLDSLQNGSIRLSGFIDVYPYAALVIANHSPDSGQHSYQYQADVVSVGEAGAAARNRTALTITPNPFKSRTKIRWTVPGAVEMTEERSLRIYNAVGRLVRRFDRRAIEPFDEVVWDGRDAHGQQVSHGVYFAEVSAGGSVHVVKCVLTK